MGRIKIWKTICCYLCGDVLRGMLISSADLSKHMFQLHSFQQLATPSCYSILLICIHAFRQCFKSRSCGLVILHLD